MDVFPYFSDLVLYVLLSFSGVGIAVGVVKLLFSAFVLNPMAALYSKVARHF